VNEAEEYLSTMATRLNIPSDRLQTAVPYGETTSSILLEIQLRKADLVVMSTHGRNGIGRAVLGSVSAGVINAATVPVLVIPPQATNSIPNRPLHVLVATDGSDRAAAVVPDVVNLVQEGRITLLRALSPSPARVMGSVQTTTQSEDGALEHDLEHLRENFEVDSVVIDIQTAQGEPAMVIRAKAEELGADVIAISTHGRTGAPRLIMGSVAEALMSSATVPLLIRRPNFQEHKGGHGAPELPFI
jgi:nucleotide-binding universal stress UspA family protein